MSKNKHKEAGRRSSQKFGMPPGALVHVGKVILDKTSINIIEFNQEELLERKITNLEDLTHAAPGKKRWIDVKGLHQVEVIEAAGKALDIHPLLLEDLLNTHQRPKFEDYDNRLFFTLKAFHLKNGGPLEQEQVTFVLGADFLATFQESDKPIFDPILDRLKASRGKIRIKGIDYLLYALMDVIVDHYYVVVDILGDRLDDLEDLMNENPGPEAFELNRQLRKEIGVMLKTLIPLREAVQELKNDDSELTDESTAKYIDDILDHVIQLNETMESYREMSSEIKDTYMSGITFRTNQIMKVLTVITSIFIPLSFIAGVYGMNFKNMPELSWKYGYLAVWVAMIAITLGMIIWTKRKKWL